MDESLVTRAATNNALWCDFVCRMQGIEGALGEDAWTSAVRTPTHYPDAVTVRRAVNAQDILGLVDTTPGCSIKDSYADLDLTPWGFEVLLEGAWICWSPDSLGDHDDSPNSLRWTPLRDADELAEWDNVRGRGILDHGDYPEGILSRPGIVVLGGFRRDEIVGGAVLCEAAGVISLANVFASGIAPAEVFRGAVKAAALRHPATPVVGYETGTDLEAALAAGCQSLGPMAVWRRA